MQSPVSSLGDLALPSRGLAAVICESCEKKTFLFSEADVFGVSSEPRPQLGFAS
jgi:hypothetical protein